jgi:glutamine amidotransferase
MPTKICIIDYKAGNLGSVENAIRHLGYDVEISSIASKILDSDGIIFPGVGAFGDCMNNLKMSGLIKEHLFENIVDEQIPLFGICVGMQMLFEESEEMGLHKGLGLINGNVTRFPFNVKCPQIGWNSISINDPEFYIFNGIADGSYFYFVHSYYCNCLEDSDIIATTDYSGIKFASMVKKGNIIASQFHPEKSGKIGLKLLINFLDSIKR